MEIPIKPFLTQLPCPIRTYDIDSARHVSNIVYIRWLEDLRLQMLKEHFPLRPLFDQGITPVITRTEIDYRKALALFDEPVGKIWMTDMGNIKFTLEAEIMIGEEVAASARQEGIFYNINNQRPARIPEELNEKYQAYFIV